MSDENDIPQRLRDLRCGDYSRDLCDTAADEIDRLRAELAKANAERDEARQRCCVALMGTGVWRQPRMDLPGGAWTPQLIAKELGWDCFEKEVKR